MNYEIPLNSSNLTAIVDAVDYERVARKTWYLTKQGCAVHSVGGGYPNQNYSRIYIKLPHFILGKPKKGFVVDHKNGNPLDNRRSNLRIVTYSENNRNRKGTLKRFMENSLDENDKKPI